MDRSKLTDQIVYSLGKNAAALHAMWSCPEGTNTRHFVLDNLLPPDVAREIHNAYPTDGAGFRQQASTKEHKRTSADLSKFAPILREVSYAFHEPTVVAAVADITGISTLEPDPLFYAGGLSMMFHGDFLNPHIDNSHDAKRDRYRRMNLLYYVSPNWGAENGGNFELWDESRRVPKVIVSAFNRLLVMETTKASYHSVNRVLVARPRCCVSNYFFSKQSSTGTDYFHVTSFFGRPEQPFLRAIGYVDNAARNLVARFIGGRGRKAVNMTTSQKSAGSRSPATKAERRRST